METARYFNCETELSQQGFPPPRHAVPQEDTWDLSPLYPTPQDWESEFSQLSLEFPKIRNFEGTLSGSPSCLLQALEFEKSIDQKIEQLNQYASLKMSEDNADADSLAREARLQSLLTKIGEAFSFLAPEIQAIEDDSFQRFLESAELEPWILPLKKLRRNKPHTLSSKEERLLSLGSAVMGGHGDTFSQLTNVDMKFGKVRNDAGEEIELTQSSYSSLLVQREPEVRKNAFHSFYKGFSEHQFTMASTYANSVRSDVFFARARNHPSALEAALFQDDVPVSVYENLISSARANLSPLFRYFGVRRKALRLEELHQYDTYVPLVEGVKTDVSWDEAVEMVLSAVAPLGEEYTRVLRGGLTAERWCDRYENRNKRSGAFSYGTYQSPPYIMMNYKRDVFSDVFTLAHEAGHSMHTWYSQRAQSYQNYHYPIFLAEVASTYNEVLLTEYLLSKTQDPAMRLYLINRQVDDFRGTLYRQTMFAEFEKESHALEEAGGPLTLDSLREVYRKLLDAYFGSSVVVDKELELECLRIPHFYNAFYVYKYATGLSAAVALAGQTLKSGEPSRYLDFLRSGGSRYPLETLQAAGVDMTSPEPVDAALSLFERRVEEMANLLS